MKGTCSMFFRHCLTLTLRILLMFITATPQGCFLTVARLSDFTENVNTCKFYISPLKDHNYPMQSMILIPHRSSIRRENNKTFSLGRLYSIRSTFLFHNRYNRFWTWKFIWRFPLSPVSVSIAFINYIIILLSKFLLNASLLFQPQIKIIMLILFLFQTPKTFHEAKTFDKQ